MTTTIKSLVGIARVSYCKYFEPVSSISKTLQVCLEIKITVSLSRDNDTVSTISEINHLFEVSQR